MNFKFFLKLWLPVFLWCGVIFTLSSIPTLPSAKIIWWDFILKKSAHITEYAILYYLVYRAFSQKFKIKNFSLFSFLFALCYSLSDEYHQYFVPGRHMKLMDIGFDSLGMLISLHWIKKKHY
jgi:VanZ family protein